MCGKMGRIINYIRKSWNGRGLDKKLGERLIEKEVISETDLQRAHARQRLHGGSLEDNLVALELASKEELESVFDAVPRPPASVEETGLSLTFIAELILKHAYYMGEFTLGHVAARVMLPISIVEEAIEDLRVKHFVEVRGADQFAKLTYRFYATDTGRKKAERLLAGCRYVGAAPVTLEDYRKIVEMQTIRGALVTEEALRKAFEGLVVGDEFFRRLGPAVNSGKAIFLHGPAGNGKTTIAERIGGALPGFVYIPHALYVGGQIISIFDPMVHVPVEEDFKGDSIDKRWLAVKRPAVITGGELTLKMLDLELIAESMYYEAPFQVKANNGVLIIDDFGRQQIEPRDLLNRWIVPLERREDYLTLHTGMKFEVPFDMLVIFSTNIEPARLVDEAFLRRIRYKIKIGRPSADEFEEIFKRVCEANKIEFDERVFDYLVEKYYKKFKIEPSACHPRDLIDRIVDSAHYHNHPPRLTKEEIAEAWKDYFVEP